MTDKRKLLWTVILVASTGCARLPTLTPDILASAEMKWSSHRPESYRLVIEMSGDRVETGQFEVEVRSNHLLSLRRNGLVIRPNAGEDYTMEGLFHMLHQELDITQKPAMLGAPPGYSVYLNARFDEANGRLIGYRRIVGGASNSIEVKVVKFEAR
jgi:hypothetical protein